MSFSIERKGDGFGRFAVGIIPKDPADDLGLLAIDRTFAANAFPLCIAELENIVAITQPAP
ncbi:hypothetical protein ACFFLJ_06535 [Acetobacter farinalis]|uniref:hypothetical protein n=1 Tax=Acetobacter farinalis TaxID=1260984 RepID=UPI0030B81BC3